MNTNTLYQNKETGETLTENDLYELYRHYIDNELIDDHGFADFVDGATDENTGLYIISGSDCAIRQTLELIQSDYSDAVITDSYTDGSVKIECIDSLEYWVIDQLGNIIMHNGFWA